VDLEQEEFSTSDPSVAVGMWAIDDDYLTVTMLAAGVAQLVERQQHVASGGHSDDALLPGAWRVAFARLWWRYHAQGVPCPTSDLEVLALCNRPFRAWPVALELAESDLDSALLENGDLSAFAAQGARLARVDVEAEWVEQRVHRALRTAASANGNNDVEVEQAYAYLRRYLIDHAVISDLQVQSLEQWYPEKGSNEQTYVRQLVAEAYHARPASGSQTILLCPGCRNALTQPSDTCGTAGCAGGEPERTVLRALAVIHEQHRATRMFIHDPGLVEARIIDALNSKQLHDKVRVTAYPRVDLLDVLIEFLTPAPDGTLTVVESWGVDAKDQQSASLLGRGFSWPAQMDCKRRLLALPMHRASQPAYMSDLVAELDGRVRGVEVIDEKRLIADVCKRAERFSR